jgi:hypothetical protein
LISEAFQMRSDLGPMLDAQNPDGDPLRPTAPQQFGESREFCHRGLPAFLHTFAFLS